MLDIDRTKIMHFCNINSENKYQVIMAKVVKENFGPLSTPLSTPWEQNDVTP